jgi:4'-phosphopantetheinyl transferase
MRVRIPSGAPPTTALAARGRWLGTVSASDGYRMLAAPSRSTIRMAPEALANAVHLWVALEPHRSQAGLAAAYRELMSGEERARELTLAREQDRSLYRLGRVLVRTVLSRYAAVDPRDWAFAANAFGRPRIASPSGLTLEFNLAHTAGAAVLLVGAGRLLGVDVERSSRTVATGPALPLLGRTEAADLRDRSGESRRRRFLEYWTLKEAFAKAVGVGISLPLDRCIFSIGVDAVRATMDPALDRCPGRWEFKLVSSVPGFIVAVALTRRYSGEVLRLEQFSTTPLRD